MGSVKHMRHLGTHHREENADIDAKLLVRRYFLEKYHAAAKRDELGVARYEQSIAPPRVFDACQAGGAIWGQLRQEYVVRYWGVDLKPQKRGTLKMDSVRVLAQPGTAFDVIDVDTFGTPWDHWLAVLPHLRKPTTIFLTIGRIGGGVNDLSNEALEWLGLGPLVKRLPTALRWRVAFHAGDTILTAPIAFGLRIVEMQEASPSKRARYVGVRLEPSSSTPSPSRHG